ncbi:MAG TPA: flagellar FliJ family protein [Terricaulis sp.]|nr:flagellar FliJ family protein [Terricaulis sp.]
MKSLHTLLKIAEGDLETLRRALAALIARQTAVEERIRAHEQSIVNEQRIAAQDYESQRAYGGFIQLALQGKRALEAEGAAIEEEIARMRALISEAHVEMRKFERLIELEAERAKVLADKREAAELDEFATLRAARQPRER